MSRSRQATRRILSPVLRFLEIEAAGGLVLLAATTVALAWASSPWSGSYRALLDTELSLGVGLWHFTRPLSFWVNDGLMTLFFFVVGLEIRRDIHDGELSHPRRAMLPVVAALAGMLLPAAIFIACNLGRAGVRGWGIPMATDIAFAVGILSVLGRRVAPPLRIFLLALAIIDDIGAIVVIAIFYAGGITLPGLALASVGVAAVLVLKATEVRSPAAYLPAGVVVWAGLYAAGIHPTLAGVTLALLTPVRPAQSADVDTDVRSEADLRARDPTMPPSEVRSPAEVRLSGAERSPATYLQDALHPWVTFVIMPVFAFVNAGVALGGASLAGDAGFVFVGIVLGLSVGKPAAILLAVRASARWALPSRPLPAAGLAVTGIVAGVGFTMALFIAQLAFPPGPLLDTAKVAVLVGSLVSAVATLTIGRAILTSPAVAAAVSSGSPARDGLAAGSAEASVHR
jgi:NhaA family Na+:H+ antiporter